MLNETSATRSIRPRGALGPVRLLREIHTRRAHGHSQLFLSVSRKDQYGDGVQSVAQHKCELVVDVAAVGLLLKTVADTHASCEEAHTLRFNLKLIMAGCVWNDDIVGNSNRRHGISNLGHIADSLEAHVPWKGVAGDAVVCVQVRAANGVISPYAVN